MSDCLYVAKEKLEIFWFTVEKQKTERLESSAVYIIDYIIQYTVKIPWVQIGFKRLL